MAYKPNLTLLAQRANYQSSLWGDTYLTPEEARVYIEQMLTMLGAERKQKEKQNATK